MVSILKELSLFRMLYPHIQHSLMLKEALWMIASLDNDRTKALVTEELKLLPELRTYKTWLIAFAALMP